MTAGEKKPPPAAAPEGPFAALAGLREGLPAGPASSTGAATSPPAKEPAKGPARAVVRLERKGRGGKEATIVEKLGLPAAELGRWCKEAKAAMGCGGSVDGDSLVLQGDLRRRLEPWLVARGVRKVTVA